MALEDESSPGAAWCCGGDFGPSDRVIEVAGAVDTDGWCEPAWIGLRDGALTGVSAKPPSDEAASLVHRPELLVTPALINPHAHLDLTSVGPVGIDGGFDHWLETVRTRRPDSDPAIRSSIEAGLAASRAGGVVGVGDIVGARPETALDALGHGDLASVAFIECLGIGRREEVGLEMVDRVRHHLASRAGGRTEVGLSPHAPYSCSSAVYEAAVASGLPVTTHVAESLEELEFCREGRGPLVSLLRRVGAIGTEDVVAGAGRHPVTQLPPSETHPWVLAHVNLPGSTEEEEREVFAWLRTNRATVVYCPRAAAMLGHLSRANAVHPWRRMVDRGVRVAIGTDGSPCLDRADRISPMDDLSRVLERPEDLPRLLGMATVAGADALGWNPDALRFRTGCAAGVIGVAVGGRGVFEGLRRGPGRIEWLLPPNPEALRHRGRR